MNNPEDLCYLTATEALELFRKKALSPVELLEALIARAETVEPKINAFAFTYYDEAMRDAKAAENRYMKGNARPLEGIPIAVKDEFLIEGKITTNGSLALQNDVADYTSPMVERIQDAGAIIHARTTTPEFSIAIITWSKIWGVTRNPWNLDCTPGGSSGGAGASLAAGTTTMALGSDIAGSIRVPAAFNGVFGYKPPHGRNPSDPPFGLEYYEVTGPLTRSVADSVLFQNVVSGPYPADIATHIPKPEFPAKFDGIKDWRIAYSLDLGYKHLQPGVRENTLAAIEQFRALGAAVEEVDLGWTSELTKAALDHILYSPVMNYFVVMQYHEHKELLTSYFQDFAERSAKVTPEEALNAETTAIERFKDMNAVFKNYDIFLCPTIAVDFVPADFDSTKDSIDGFENSPFGWALTYPFNMLGYCPVLSVPTGRAAATNVPTGLQIVAPPFEDSRVFQAGAAYEAFSSPNYQAGNRPDLG